MEAMGLYHRVQQEMEVIRYRIEEIKNQIHLLRRQLGGPEELRAIDYSRGPKGSYSPKPLETAFMELIELENQLFHENQRLQEKQQLLNKLEKLLGDQSSLEARIAYGKEVEGKKLVELADELGYSYQYVREKYARYKRTYNQRTDRGEKGC